MKKGALFLVMKRDETSALLPSPPLFHFLPLFLLISLSLFLALSSSLCVFRSLRLFLSLPFFFLSLSLAFSVLLSLRLFPMSLSLSRALFPSSFLPVCCLDGPNLHVVTYDLCFRRTPDPVIVA